MMKRNLLTQLFSLVLCLFMVASVNAQTTIIDYETSTTQFAYFGNTAASDPPNNLTRIIPNPDMTGLNAGSTLVGEFTKYGGAAFFAGAFADFPVDFTSYNEVCFKVWSPIPSNLLFKVEQPTTGNGADTWEQQQEITTTNAWTEVCFDSSVPDASNFNFPAANGRVFNRAVIFFDFGSNPPGPANAGNDITFYFDDMEGRGTPIAPPPLPSPGDITFSVNMNNYTGQAFTAVNVFGSFNGWNPFANPLQDPDGDGIWEVTLPLPAGGIEYKYILVLDNGGLMEETFPPNDPNFPCTQTFDFGPGAVFVNRVYDVDGDDAIPLYFWNTCIAPNNVPTMGEWAVFILFLLIIAIGGVFITNAQRQSALATGNANISMGSTFRNLPFNRENYIKGIKNALGLAVVGFAVIMLGWGEIVFADLVGMAISIPVVAYIIHMLYADEQEA